MNKRGILIWHLCIILILSVQYTKEKPCSFLTFVCKVLHKTRIKQSIFSMHQWQTVSGNCFLEFGHKRTHIYTLRNIFGLLISARARDVSGIPESKSLMSGARLDRDTVNAAWQQRRNCREWSSLASSTRYCEICLTYSSGLVLETPVLLSLTKTVQIGGPPTTTNNLFSAALPDHNNGNRRRQRTRNQAASVSVQLR